MKWQDKAACDGVEPELFFPVAAEGTEVFARQAAPALAVCGRCPVWRACLDEALRGGLVGIWGGTTDAQRGLLKAAA